MTQISSLSISGRITLDMHSLNNEGNEGNQVLTRQVTIIDENGKPATVTAVSGDMMKHILCEHFWKIAIEENLPLSETSKSFNANRIITTDVPKADKNDHSKSTDEILQTCALSDIAGAMITDLGNFARKSVAEFGWLVALPQANETENYFHAKYVPDAKGVKEVEEEDEESKKGNVGQNIFHRPANSGIYAFVTNLEIARLGYNDISKLYPIDDKDREKRYEALLKSVLYTFIKPNGAMRNTQNPHIVNFEGVISYSTSTCPAPTVSALNSNYVKEIEATATNLNKVTNDSLVTLPFDSLSDFTEKMSNIIIDTKPVKLETKKTDE
ncbi:MAG: DevR family CRISPR-associated autoregulator [Bacteroidales bacterium]|nr:DevR family CRISPR-associated autoregulator [Bacteroidales bacterium]